MWTVIYLGLHSSVEAGAALVVDGELVGAVHEERFVRVKHFAGFPSHSIDYVLGLAGLRLDQVDKIVCGMIESVVPNEAVLASLTRRMIDGVVETPALAQKYHERLTSEVAWNREFMDELVGQLRRFGVADKLHTIDHHRSHAAGAYFASPFSDCLAFTCDGKGGFKSSSVWRGKAGTLTELDFGTTFDSAGYFYGNITRALGFEAERHEGKITGLAAHGDPAKFRHVTDRALTTRDGRIHASLGDWYMPWFTTSEHMPQFFKACSEARREDVAAAAQATLETVICDWIAASVRRFAGSGPVNVALAGGVFANVKLNQRVRELGGVKNVFVFPPMGDGGIPLGSICAQMADDGTPFRGPLRSMCLGPNTPRAEARRLLDGKGIKYREVNSVADTMVELFTQQRPVGLFRGRMEFGPRALCNRSILYHAKDASVNQWLNHQLNRSEFMPFAPVTTAELAPRCFVGWAADHPAADFMTMTYDCTPEFRETCGASVHVDGTARPQIVRSDVDPEMHAILTRYHQVTGELAIINTSFNDHEEPIVSSVEDALSSMAKGNVNALLLEGLLVER